MNVFLGIHPMRLKIGIDNYGYLRLLREVGLQKCQEFLY